MATNEPRTETTQPEQGLDLASLPVEHRKLHAELKELRYRLKRRNADVARLRKKLTQAEKEQAKPHRERLPHTRNSITHKFNVSGHEGYISVGLYPDGRPAEVFLTVAKQGSTLRGMADTIAVLTSLALQYGVGVDALARKFRGTCFEPMGHTKNAEIKTATSLIDYVYTWLGTTFSDEFRDEYKAAQAALEEYEGDSNGIPDSPPRP